MRLTRRLFGLFASGTLAGAALRPADGWTSPARIVIERFEFRPSDLVVPVGSEIIWFNADIVPHTATFDNEDWDTGELVTDARRGLLFDQPGVFSYYCRYHPHMRARIQVR